MLGPHKYFVNEKRVPESLMFIPQLSGIFGSKLASKSSMSR